MLNCTTALAYNCIHADLGDFKYVNKHYRNYIKQILWHNAWPFLPIGHVQEIDLVSSSYSKYND